MDPFSLSQNNLAVKLYALGDFIKMYTCFFIEIVW